MRTVCQCISPHLVADVDVIVRPLSVPLSPRKQIAHGTKFYDGGALMLREEEADKILREFPQVFPYVRNMLDARRLLYDGKDRFCLFLDGCDQSILSIPPIADRLKRRDAFLESSKAECAQTFLKRLRVNPQCQMYYVCPKADTYIAVPATMTDSREYVPMNFVDGSIAVNATLYAVIDGDKADFAVLSSRMHMVWVKAVTGRIEHNLTYSPAPVYNTFPWPPLDGNSVAVLNEMTSAVLEARRQDGRCLAKLYDPSGMPDALRKAHERLDEFIESLYSPEGFRTDADRLACLLRMYSEASVSRLNDSEGINLWM